MGETTDLADEPYLWPFYFLLDGSRARIRIEIPPEPTMASDGSIDTPITSTYIVPQQYPPVSGPPFHFWAPQPQASDFPDGVQTGEEFPVPELIGTWKTLAQPMLGEVFVIGDDTIPETVPVKQVLIPPYVGCVVVVLEEDETTALTMAEKWAKANARIPQFLAEQLQGSVYGGHAFLPGDGGPMVLSPPLDTEYFREHLVTAAEIKGVTEEIKKTSAVDKFKEAFLRHPWLPFVALDKDDVIGAPYFVQSVEDVLEAGDEQWQNDAPLEPHRIELGANSDADGSYVVRAEIDAEPLSPRGIPPPRLGSLEVSLHWEPLPGSWTSEPIAVTYDESSLDDYAVFARGENGAIWRYRRLPGQPDSISPLTGLSTDATVARGAGAALLFSGDTLVCARSVTDGRYYTTAVTQQGSHSGAWGPIGDFVGHTSPSLIATGDAVFAFAVRFVDPSRPEFGEPWWATASPPSTSGADLAWSDWRRLEGQNVRSGISALRVSDEIHVFAEGDDGLPRGREFGVPADWATICGENVSGRPAVITYGGSDEQRIFALEPGSELVTAGVGDSQWLQRKQHFAYEPTAIGALANRYFLTARVFGVDEFNKLQTAYDFFQLPSA